MYGLCRTLLLTAATVSLSLCVSLPLSAIPQRPVPQKLVNDFADIFTREQEARLERALVEFDDSTSNQIAVVTVNDLEGYDAASFATRIGLDWQVGSSEFNNGVVVLVKPKTGNSAGEVFIAVGYGLEGAIPDVYAKRIIENEMIPRFRENDYFGGVADACVTLMQLASGEISEPRESEEDTVAVVISFIFMIILIVIIFRAVSGGRNGGDDGTVIMMGGGRHHHGNYGGFGGGSFGGGSFGGGGFGGFGGGSFGGGGAGGKW